MNSILNLSSLLIAFASLVISVVALLIARKVYFFSSKDYLPEIDFTIMENNVRIKHSSYDLFVIKSVSVLKLETIGFFNSKKKKIVQFSFVAESKMNQWIESNGRQKNITFSLNSPGACAYICPYPEDKINAVREKININYSPLDGKKGSVLPSLQSLGYLVEIYYQNKFQESKSLLFQYQHLHGHGFEKFKLTQDEFNNNLKKVNLPKFDTVDDLWNFIITKYSLDENDYYAR